MSIGNPDQLSASPSDGEAVMPPTDEMLEHLKKHLQGSDEDKERVDLTELYYAAMEAHGIAMELGPDNPYYKVGDVIPMYEGIGAIRKGYGLVVGCEPEPFPPDLDGKGGFNVITLRSPGQYKFISGVHAKKREFNQQTYLDNLRLNARRQIAEQKGKTLEWNEKPEELDEDINYTITAFVTSIHSRDDLKHLYEEADEKVAEYTEHREKLLDRLEELYNKHWANIDILIMYGFPREKKGALELVRNLTGKKKKKHRLTTDEGDVSTEELDVDVEDVPVGELP